MPTNVGTNTLRTYPLTPDTHSILEIETQESTIRIHSGFGATHNYGQPLQSRLPSRVYRSLYLVVTQTKEPYERGLCPTISFPSSWDPAQPSTPSSPHRLWYRLFRVWYDHPLKVGHHSLRSFLSRRAIPHSTGIAMGYEIWIVVRYLIGLFFTILTKRIIQ